MDHFLRSISYIADIGDLVVIMARRGPVEHLPPESAEHPPRIKTKICCHVFESEEVGVLSESRAFCYCLHLLVVCFVVARRRR